MRKTTQSKMAIPGELADDLEKLAKEFRQAGRNGIHIRHDRCLANADLLDKYVKMLRKTAPLTFP